MKKRFHAPGLRRALAGFRQPVEALLAKRNVPGRSLPATQYGLLVLAALLVTQAQAAAARDPAAGAVRCARGPLGERAQVEDALIGTLFDVRTSLDVACELPPYGPLLPSSSRLAGGNAPGAALVAADHGADLPPFGPPQAAGARASAPPRREDVAPGARSEVPGEPLGGVVSELRFGVLSHDIVFPGMRNLTAPNPFRHHFERGVNLNAEIAFVSPGFFRYILSPRPRVGGSVNTLGYTSNAYVDLDWRYQLRAGPFFEGFLGVAVHDGKLRDANPEFAELGTRFLFHIGLEAGLRVFGRHGLSVFWEHMSNSALARKNQGMDSTGIRYGYRFAE